jgi:hypothetical protein
VPDESLATLRDYENRIETLMKQEAGSTEDSTTKEPEV